MKYTNLFDYKKTNQEDPKKKVLKVKKSNGNGGGGDQEEPKKVDKVPEGFVQFKKEGNKTFFKRNISKVSPVELKPAFQKKPGQGSSIKEKTDYFNKMVDMVKSGVNPQDLVDKKYIDPSSALKLQPYFKPTSKEEVVFTEEMIPTQPTPPKPKPITAYNHEHIFGPDKHALGAVLEMTRDSKDFARQQGDVNPNNEHVWFGFYKPNSTEIDESKGYYKIPAGVWANKISEGTTSVQRPDLVSEILKYKYNPKDKVEKNVSEVKTELPFQATGSTGTSPRLRGGDY